MRGSGIFRAFFSAIIFSKFNNDKRYQRDFFTVDTIDDGLSFDGIRSSLSKNFLGSIWYTVLSNACLRRYGKLVGSA
jgi:hypothetical protein